jgi:hypothetical protein
MFLLLMNRFDPFKYKKCFKFIFNKIGQTRSGFRLEFLSPLYRNRAQSPVRNDPDSGGRISSAR